MKRRLAWGLAVPLALVGSEAAHVLAYVLVYPQAHARGLVLGATGHAYFAWLPLALGLAAACALLTLVAAVVDTARGRSTHTVPAWVFALLAPAAFTLQEVLELSLHTGAFGWRAVLAPTFATGLTLQLPFALAAYVAARLLLRAARTLARALVRTPALRRAATFSASPAPAVRGRRVRPAYARGPPLVV